MQATVLPDFTDLIKETSPAVVKINVTGTESGQISPFGNQEVPEQFREFFERFSQPQERETSGVGSGFIISEDGHVVTNAHVIDDATEIIVRLNDRREYIADVIGVDERSDLALLQIGATGLPTVDLADAEELDVGDWVLAIGSPFDLDYSASAGIVSAIGRSLPTQTGENYVPFIQTDVAINPGNSGGPLFNLEGEVVGINSQIFTRSGGFMGLSFAIPVNVAQDVIDQLIEKGSVSRGWLGVLIQDVTPDLAESFGLDRPIGALVSQTVQGSPAQRAGLEAGDIIIGIDSEEIFESSDLPHVVGLIPPGREVSATVMREGRQIYVDIEIGELSDRAASASPQRPIGREPDPQEDWFGLVVEELDGEVASENGVNGGVEVVSVASDSAADRAGMRRGDVIVQIGFTSVSDLQEYADAAESVRSGSVIPVRFFRDGSSIFRTLQLDE